MAIQLPALMVQDPNIFGRFAQGQQVANQNRLLDMNAQNQEFQQNRLTANDQFQREQFTAQQEQIMRQAEGQFYGRVGDMLAATTDPAQRQEIWRNARIVAERIKIPDFQEMDAIDVTDDRNVQGIRGQAAAYGYGKPLGKSSTPAGIQEFEHVSKILRNPEAYPKDVVDFARYEAGLRARPTEAITLAGDEALTGDVAESQSEIEGAKAGAKATAKGTAERAEDLIGRGLALAESTAQLRRGLELLELVETGRPEAIGLATKRALGIEGADEAELSGALGKAVIKQYRETFGAQFTQEEGNKLDRIEASFGKSNAANKRLLGSALQVAEGVAQRARRRAMRTGDTETVEDIDYFMKRKISFPEEDAAAQPQTGTGNKRPDDEIRQLEQELGL